MPSIDVYAPHDLFPEDTEAKLAQELTAAALRAERMPVPIPGPILDMTAAYIHRLPSSAIHTARTTFARTVRVQLVVAAGGITQEGQKEFVAEATEIVSRYAGDATQAYRTWVIVMEAVTSATRLLKWRLSRIMSPLKSVAMTP